jgi:FAD dependent oxidoreductase TIGR03364
MKKYDLVIVGAGIVGMAHAYEAVQRGLSVLIIEKNQSCVGASVRNFGFITVSGQSSKDTWRRARYSRDVWASISEKAGIPIIHRGSWIVCQRPEAFDVASAFLNTEMGADCQLFSPKDFSNLESLGFKNTSVLRLDHAAGLLYSPHEFRVESRDAIPMMADWLSSSLKVDFCWGAEVFSCDDSQIHTSSGTFYADKVLICPGADLNGVAKKYIAHHDIKLCTLQMLRVKVDDHVKLPGSVMTDNSLARYLGWADLPEASALKVKIQKEMPEFLKEGIHLIAVQSSDGSLVIGDSHQYGRVEDVFAKDRIDQLIIELLGQTINFSELKVLERWTGVYPSSSQQDAIIEKVSDSLRVALVTSGTGASTAFGLAKDNFDDWI